MEASYRKMLTGLSVYIQQSAGLFKFPYSSFPLYTLYTFCISDSETVTKDTGWSSMCASSGCDLCHPVCQGGREFQEQLEGLCFPMGMDNCPLHKAWLRALGARKIISSLQNPQNTDRSTPALHSVSLVEMTANTICPLAQPGVGLQGLIIVFPRRTQTSPQSFAPEHIPKTYKI